MGSIRSLFEEEKRPESEQNDFFALTSNLLVCDTLEHRLALARFGKPYPAKSSYKSDIVELSPDRLYQVNNEDPEWLPGDISSVLMQDPFEWCRQRVDAERDSLKNTVHDGKVGEFGACAFVQHGEIRFRTAFEDHADLIENMW